MAETIYFANKGTLKITGTGGTPAEQTVAVIKDVEITDHAEHVGLWGWGSIERQGVARHSAEVDVKIGFAKFAPATSGTIWWPFYSESPTAGAVTAGREDTNTVKTFTVVATMTGEDGSVLTITVTNVYFPSFPTKMSEGQWVRVDMDGKGSKVTYSYAV
jgi:hypothetical protein